MPPPELGAEHLARHGRAGRGAGLAGQVVERGVLRGHARAPRVAGGRAQLQLELVGGLEAPVRRQERVGGRLTGVVDERVELRDAPAEEQRGGEGRVGHAL